MKKQKQWLGRLTMSGVFCVLMADTALPVYQDLADEVEGVRERLLDGRIFHKAEDESEVRRLLLDAGVLTESEYNRLMAGMKLPEADEPSQNPDPGGLDGPRVPEAARPAQDPDSGWLDGPGDFKGVLGARSFLGAMIGMRGLPGTEEPHASLGFEFSRKFDREQYLFVRYVELSPTKDDSAQSLWYRSMAAGWGYGRQVSGRGQAYVEGYLAHKEWEQWFSEDDDFGVGVLAGFRYVPTERILLDMSLGMSEPEGLTTKSEVLYRPAEKRFGFFASYLTYEDDFPTGSHLAVGVRFFR